MDISTIQFLANFGALGVFMILILTQVLVPGWVHKEMKEAYEKLQTAYEARGDALTLERQRNADLQQLAATGTKAMTALAEIAEEQRRHRQLTPPDGTQALSGGPPT